jgi:homoserine dehydrogenase
MPTASAVVADMIDTAVGRTAITFRTLELWSQRESQVTLRTFDDLPGRYYLRFEVDDVPGVLSQIARVLGEHAVSIASIIQHERHPGRAEPTVTLVIMTHQAPEGAARKAVQQIAQLPVVHSGSTRMRVMEEGQ